MYVGYSGGWKIFVYVQKNSAEKLRRKKMGEVLLISTAKKKSVSIFGLMVYWLVKNTKKVKTPNKMIAFLQVASCETKHFGGKKNWAKIFFRR